MAISALLAAPLLIGAGPAGRLEVDVDNVRSKRGQIRLCLTQSPAHFPDCRGDPAARRLAVPAGATAAPAFEGLSSGDYAVAVIHDENGNARLDTFAKIPREGFGFSRNPPIGFGPPRFGQASFHVGAGTERKTVKLRYIL